MDTTLYSLLLKKIRQSSDSGIESIVEKSRDPVEGTVVYTFNYKDDTGEILSSDMTFKNGENVIGLGVVNDILYFREDADITPVTHDVRLRKEAQYLYIERYDGTVWETTGRVGGSIQSDKFVLNGNMIEIKNVDSQEAYSIWRVTSTPGGNEFGSSKRRLWLIGESKDNFTMTFPTDWHDTIIENQKTTNLVGTIFEKTFVADKSVELEFFAMELYKPTKAKMTLIDIQDGNRIIYETIPTAEYVETGGVQLVEFSNPSINTGFINVKLKNLAYVIEGREYKMILETLDSGFKGSTTFPYVVNRGKIFENETIASREWIQSTPTFKRAETDGVFYLKGNSVDLGSIRASVIDNKIHYEELKSTGWEIANVFDINLGERGLLSERLDALENAREFKGDFDATGDLTQLNDAQTGFYWIVSVGGTIAGKTFSVNDMIICHTAIATPIDFTNFATIPASINIMQGATNTTDGTSGLVPRPLIADEEKALMGNGTWRKLPTLEDENTFVSLQKFNNNIQLKNSLGGLNELRPNQTLQNGATAYSYLPNNGGLLARAEDVPVVATATPTKISTTSGLGTSNKYAKEDHVHGLDLATQSLQGAMSSLDKTKLDGFSAMDSTLPQGLDGSESAGTSSKPARVDHKHKILHSQFGYDLTTTQTPKAVFRDKFLTSGINSATINANNIPWVYANIEQAERSLPYWIQELTTFFKNLENDSQFDQLIGGIPSNFSIPYGSWGVQPSQSTDMDNIVVAGSGNYATEYFEFIVGRNPQKTEIYSFAFTFASFVGANYDVNNVANPFRIIYQTSRNIGNPNFQNNSVTSISNSTPRCSQRPSSYQTSSYGTPSFPLMFEPITIEIDK